MTWVALFNRLLAALRAFADWVRSAKDIELGRLREKERQRESDMATRDAVNRADPDRVLDSDAFGALGQDNDLRRTFESRPSPKTDK